MVANDGLNRWDLLGFKSGIPFSSGITFEIDNKGIKDKYGEECACLLDSVTFNIRGGLGSSNDDWEKDLDELNDAVNILSYFPTSINPADVIVHTAGKVFQLPDISNVFAMNIENQKLLMNVLPDYEVKTNIDYSGPDTIRQMKPEFVDNPIKAAVYINSGGDSDDLFFDDPVKKAPVFRKGDDQRFRYYENAVEAALKQLERQIELICKDVI
jgi:hypothetical protein